MWCITLVRVLRLRRPLSSFQCLYGSSEPTRYDSPLLFTQWCTAWWIFVFWHILKEKTHLWLCIVIRSGRDFYFPQGGRWTLLLSSHWGQEGVSHVICYLACLVNMMWWKIWPAYRKVVGSNLEWTHSLCVFISFAHPSFSVFPVEASPSERWGGVADVSRGWITGRGSWAEI